MVPGPAFADIGARVWVWAPCVVAVLLSCLLGCWWGLPTAEAQSLASGGVRGRLVGVDGGSGVRGAAGVAAGGS